MPAAGSASGITGSPPLHRPLLVAAALGEMLVGALVALFPATVAGVLLAAPLEGAGLVVARMAGIAIAALGWTWWRAQQQPFGQRVVAGGFLLYNFGVGLLFLAYAWQHEGSRWVPLVVGIAHVIVGAGFALAARSSSVAVQ